MVKHYVNALGALKRIERTSDFIGPEGYKEVTEADYTLLLEELQKRRQARVLLAMQQYQESELQTAREAYNELRTLGMSEKVARAMTKYYG